MLDSIVAIGDGGLLGIMLAVPMVLITVALHYEMLYWLSRNIPKMKFLHGRVRILAVILGAFTAHVIEIWLYGVAFYTLGEIAHVGSLEGEIVTNSFWEYLYFSTVSYTSLGVGDIFPSGAIRMLTGVEALNGFVLITWSASFAYLYMEKFWDLPKK